MAVRGLIPKKWVAEEIHYRAVKISIGRDFLIFILYFASLVSMVSIHSNVDLAYDMQRTFRESLIEPDDNNQIDPFDDLVSPEEWFTWAKTILIPGVYEKAWYNEDTYSPAVENTVGLQTKLIGGMRLTQKRYESGKGSICYTTDYSKITGRCFGGSTQSDSFPCGGRGCCDPGNQVAYSPQKCCNETGPRYTATNRNGSEFCAYSDISPGLTHTCTAYGACGYFIEFNYTSTKDDALTQLSSLEKARWWDGHTKSVHAEFVGYNNNYKKFIYVDVGVEINLVGYMKKSTTLRVLDLRPYEGPDGESVRAADIIFLIVASLSIVHCIVKIVLVALYSGSRWRQAKRYMFGIIIDIVQGVLGIMMLVKYLQFLNSKDIDYVDSVLDSYSLPGQENGRYSSPAFNKFFSLAEVARYDVELSSTATILLMLQVVSALHTFRIMLRMEKMMNSLGGAIPELLAFVPIYIFILISYSLSAHSEYGEYLPEFKTLSDSVFSIYELNFGLLELDPMWVFQTPGSLLFIFTATVVFVMVLLNVFLSIILAAWETAKAHVRLSGQKELVGICAATMLQALRDIHLSTRKLHEIAHTLKKLPGWEVASSNYVAHKNLPKYYREYGKKKPGLSAANLIFLQSRRAAMDNDCISREDIRDIFASRDDIPNRLKSRIYEWFSLEILDSECDQKGGFDADVPEPDAPDSKQGIELSGIDERNGSPLLAQGDSKVRGESGRPSVV